MAFHIKHGGWVLATVLALAAGSWAAEQPLKLAGSVRDSHGSPLAEAQVQLLAGGSLLRTVTTSVSGDYELADLTPGLYTVLVNLAGFAPALIQDLEVGRESLLRGDFDLRPLSELPGPEAPIWRLRAWRGAILRDQEADNPQVTAAAEPAAALPLPLNAEVRLLSRVSLGESDTDALIPQAQIALSSFPDSSWGWNVRGLLPNNQQTWFRTQGAFHRTLTADHEMQVYALAARLPFRSLDSLDRSLADEAALSSWVTSLEAEDHWNSSRSFSLTYGIGLEHYQYRRGSDLLTPRIRAHYTPPLGGELEAGVIVSGSGPGKEQVVDELFEELREFSGRSDLQPERRIRFEVGYSRSFSSADRLRVVTYRSEIEADLLGLRSSLIDADRPGYQLINLGDQVRNGLELSYRRRIIRQVVGEVVYRYAAVESTPLREQLLQEIWHGLEFQPGTSGWHDVSTAIDANISQTGTRILAHYRWNSGYPGVLHSQGSENPFSSFSRVDLSLAQSFPVAGLDELDWEALVGIQNLFNNPRAGLLDFGDQPTLDAPRQIVGGLGLKF
jgi:hypothetical protein